MSLLSRTAALGLAMACFAAPASAGGFGVIATGGTIQNQIYVYDVNSDQYLINQQRPTGGFGLQGVLGDKDDRFVGTARFYYLRESPQLSEGVGQIAVDAGAEGGVGDMTFGTRDEVRVVGVATAGVQWGLIGDPLGLQLNALTNIGTGFLTNNHTEYLLAQVGIGGHYTISESFQVNAELLYDLRYRKAFYSGGGLTVGVRYLFD